MTGQKNREDEALDHPEEQDGDAEAEQEQKQDAGTSLDRRTNRHGFIAHISFFCAHGSLQCSRSPISDLSRRIEKKPDLRESKARFKASSLRSPVSSPSQIHIPQSAFRNRQVSTCSTPVLPAKGSRRHSCIGMHRSTQ